MPPTQAPIVVVGDGEFAEIACEYFTHDSPYEVAAFAVERAFRRRDRLFDRPVVDFEDVEARFPPERFGAFVAVTFTQLNRVRARLFRLPLTGSPGPRLSLQHLHVAHHRGLASKPLSAAP